MNLITPTNTQAYTLADWEVAEINVGQYYKKFFADFFLTKTYLQKRQQQQQQMLIKELQVKTIELEKLKREVDQKDELLRKMAYHQNHHVRRPLANILGITKMICNDLNIESNGELLKLIELLQSSSDELDEAIKRSN